MDDNRTDVSGKASDDEVPRYRRLADSLIAKIENRSIGDNQAIPSERELATEFGMSRETVRKAVRYLEERGVLYSEHGRGTFVTPAVYRNMSRYVDNFSHDAIRRGGVPGQRILSIESEAASMAIAGVLGVEVGRPLTRLRRVRTINGQATGLHDAYLVLPPGARLDRGKLERTGSLYELLREQYGINPAEAAENLTVALAETEEAALLGVAQGAPLLICERVTLSEHREPIEYCLMKYVQGYRYSNRIGRRAIAM
jgi:GntR family transcriptional regulator